MKKRTIGFVLVVAGVLVSVAILLAVILLPSETVRDLVIEKLETQLGRSIAVADVSGSLFPSPRISLARMEIGAAGTAQQELISVESLILKLSFPALLSRNIEITSIVIENPLLDITLAESGISDKPKTDESLKSDQNSTIADSDHQRIPAQAGDSQQEHSGANVVSTQRQTPTMETQAEVTTSSLTSPLNIDIQKLIIRGGTIRIATATGERLLEIGEIQEELTARVTTDGEMLLTGQTRLANIQYHTPAGTLGRDLVCYLDKELTYFQNSDRLSISDATIELGELRIKITGAVDAVTSPLPSADLQLSGGPAGMENILALMPTDLFPQVAGITSSGNLTLSGSLQGPLKSANGAPPDFDFQLRLTDGSLTHPQLPQSVDQIEFQLSANPDRISITQLRLQSGGSAIKMDLDLADYRRRPQLRSTISAVIDLSALTQWPQIPDSVSLGGHLTTELILTSAGVEPEALTVTGTADITDGGYTISGQPFGLSDLNGHFEIDGTCHLPAATTTATGSSQTLQSPAEQLAAALQLLNGRIKLKADRLTLNQVPIESLTGLVIIDQRDITFERIDMSVFDGEIQLAGAMNLAETDRPQFNLESRATSVSASALYGYTRGLNNFGRLGDFLTGQINCTASLSGRLDSLLGVKLTSLSSLGSLETTSATLENHPLQQLLARYLKEPTINKLAISEWLQPFQIKDGRLNLDGMRLRADQMDIEGEGWQALDGTLELALTVRLPQEMSYQVMQEMPSELMSVLFGQRGSRIELPILISGQVTAPAICLDTNKLSTQAQQRLQQQLQSERERLKESVIDDAGKLLENLLGDEGDSTSTNQQNLEKNVKDLYKSLFKKK